MNARSKEVIPAAMSVAERAANALSKAETEAEIKALVEQSKPIVAVTDSASREVCHSSLMTLKTMRVLIEKRGKAGREEAVTYSKAVIAIEKELRGLITPEENRLAQIRDEWDSTKEREKEALIQQEIARVAQIRHFIEGIRQWPVNAAGKPSALVNQMLQTATDYEITDEVFQEFAAEAKSILMVSMAALQGIYQERLTHEAKEAQLEIDRQELIRLKAEEAERQAQARAEQARIDAAAKAAREAEQARIAEENRVERERIAAEEAEAKQLRDAETARQNAILAAERKRLADEQAETDRKNEAERARNAEAAAQIVAAREQLEREQTAARKAAEPKPEPVKTRVVERPSTAQLIALVSGHYSVSTAVAEHWLRNIRWESAAA